MRGLLMSLLQRCNACRKHYLENVPLVADETGNLSEEQIKMAYVLLDNFHRGKHVVH